MRAAWLRYGLDTWLAILLVHLRSIFSGDARRGYHWPGMHSMQIRMSSCIGIYMLDSRLNGSRLAALHTIFWSRLPIRPLSIYGLHSVLVKSKHMVFVKQRHMNCR